MAVNIIKKNRVIASIVLLLLVVPFSLSFLSAERSNRNGFELISDGEAPVMKEDLTPASTTTGGQLIFAGNFSDNINLTEVWVNYIFFKEGMENESHNESLNNIGDGIWQKEINVSANATAINYTYHFSDNSSLWNQTDNRTITVDDTIDPVANAGPDRGAKSHQPIHVDGRHCYDNIKIVHFSWWWFCPTCDKWKYLNETSGIIMGYDVDIVIHLTVVDGAGNIGEDSFNVTALDGEPPVANAGADIYIKQHEIAYFDGSNSTDNVAVTNWTWYFTLNDTLVVLFGVSPQYIFHYPGVYSITLSVMDELNNSDIISTDSLEVYVIDAQKPTADAGRDQVIEQFNLVIFDGSNSTDNIGIVEYRWNFYYLGQMRELTGIETDFFFNTAGIFEIELTVKDAQGNGDKDTFVITVLDTKKPRSDPGDDREVYIGEKVIFNASDSYDNVGIVNHTWNIEYASDIFVLYGMEVNFSFHDIGDFDVTLIVYDIRANNDTRTITITVVDNIKPIVDAGPKQRTVTPGTSLILDGSNSTDHSPLVNFTWAIDFKNKQMAELYGVKVEYTFSKIGSYLIILYVIDNAGNLNWDDIVVIVKDIIPPEIGDIPNKIAKEGQTVIFNSTATDNIRIVNQTWSFDYAGGKVELYGAVNTFLFENPGNYSIMLTVTDISGNQVNRTYWINITSLAGGDDDIGDNDDDPNGDKKDSDSEGFLSRNSTIVILGLALLFILVVFFVARGKNKVESDESLNEDDEQEVEETEETDEDEDPIEEGGENAQDSTDENSESEDIDNKENNPEEEGDKLDS